MDRFDEQARRLEKSECRHDNAIGDAGGCAVWCVECIAAALRETWDAAIDAFRNSRIEEPTTERKSP